MKNKKTTVYFNEQCGHCRNLKEWLRKYSISFTALNTEDPKIAAELSNRGINAIPFTIIEDEKSGQKEEVIGFNENRFEKIYL